MTSLREEDSWNTMTFYSEINIGKAVEIYKCLEKGYTLVGAALKVSK